MLRGARKGEGCLLVWIEIVNMRWWRDKKAKSLVRLRLRVTSVRGGFVGGAVCVVVCVCELVEEGEQGVSQK